MNQNVLFVWSDLGAGMNFVKNLVLLDTDFDFPVNTALPTVQQRLCWFKANAYPSALKANLGSWLRHEYRLRTYKDVYGFDFSDNNHADQPLHQILNASALNKLKQGKKIVFTTHGWDTAKQLNSQALPVVLVAPETPTGIQWQVRAYVEKLGPENLHNFTFDHSVAQQKQHCIDTQGIKAWCNLNITNMYHIFKDRNVEWRNWALNSGITVIPLETVINPTAESKQQLISALGINVSVQSFDQLHSMWIDLHWPYDQTLDWEYQHVFQ